MATNVIMPALEMAQETGKLLRWLKKEGEQVKQGEPVMEIETDKVTVEIEAPATGILAGITLTEGQSVPVGKTIAWILAPGEQVPVHSEPMLSGRTQPAGQDANTRTNPASTPQVHTPITASPVAAQIAREHGIDLALIKPAGGRVEKADVLAYVQTHVAAPSPKPEANGGNGGRVLASPKARRLASEKGIELTMLRGSGPNGAVLASDIPQQETPRSAPALPPAEISTIWRVMAERMTSSWTSVPHFYLARDVSALALIEMRTRISPAVEKRTGIKPTYTDLLAKVIAVALRAHPRVNASSTTAGYALNVDVNVGIAVAVEEGLIVPVIRHADQLSIGEISEQRSDLVRRANDRKLRPTDIAGGTFTLTNLGMYNVDAFNAIVNAPQAAILAVGRIADRVVPVNGRPEVRPMMMVTLSCDHRVVDGARAAQFLDDLARLIEEPWGLIA